MFVALDTSTLTLSLALLKRADGGVVAIEQLAMGPPRRQSEMLPGLVMDMLARHAVALQTLEGIAVGLGPGSFTGLRIGVATAKALAYAAQLKIAGVSSLASIALEGPEGVTLLPSVVARQGELYVGFYRRQGETVEQIEPEQALAPPQLAQILKERVDAVALGPGIAAYQVELQSLGAPPKQLVAEPQHPSALAIAKLAVFPVAQEVGALFALEPHYVRSSEAERNPAFPPLPGWAPSARIVDN
jgi:tRNA threonylcarbamoyladenosine biosynthesis protein TsaB